LDKTPAISTHCANCSFPLDQQFRYCPNCSQKVHLHRLTLHDIIHDAIHYFTHADKGIVGLVKDLVVKSGNVAKEYVSGKRKKYFPPLNFYLLIGTIYVLAIGFVAPKTNVDVLKEHPEINRIQNKDVRQYVIRIYERQYKALAFINKYSNTVSMIAVPLTCVFYWLFYIRGRYNYTEHMIACLYMGGLTNLVFALIFVPFSLVTGVKYSSMWLTGIYVVFQISYAAIFYYRFIGRTTRAAAWKAAGVSLFVTVFWIALTVLLLIWYISHGFWGFVD